MKKFLKNNILYVAFAQALVAMMGSLFFSEIMGLPPCVLCWYQRICMYPLVAIFLMGILFKDKNVYRYAFPLSLLGLGIAIYHNLLYYKILPESIAPCTSGVSCTTKFFEWFGFITIPLMALVAFSVTSLCLVIFYKLNKNSNDQRN